MCWGRRGWGRLGGQPISSVCLPLPDSQESVQRVTDEWVSSPRWLSMSSKPGMFLISRGWLLLYFSWLIPDDTCFDMWLRALLHWSGSWKSSLLGPTWKWLSLFERKKWNKKWFLIWKNQGQFKACVLGVGLNLHPQLRKQKHESHTVNL